MTVEIEKAVMVLSNLTHRASGIAIFCVAMILVFILGPFRLTARSRCMVKLSLAAILAITLYSSYSGIGAVGAAGGDGARDSAAWSTVRRHITYAYAHSALLGVFAIYLCYTCV